MEQLFITKLIIEKVRHLENIQIPLSQTKLKHLIITGKNGSGKTSVLEAMTMFLNTISTTDNLIQEEKYLLGDKRLLQLALDNKESASEILEMNKRTNIWRKETANEKKGISLEMNYPLDSIRTMFEEGKFVLASYEANRVFEADIPKHVEKIQLKDAYAIYESPRKSFVKYLLDLKMTEALAISGGKEEKANKIKEWFQNFQQLLQNIFKDDTLQLEFDEDTFQFSIHQLGKEPFDFNGLSSGYAAVLDIVVDIIIRMEKKTNKTFCFDMPGIVLIDEIETHLHLELQREVLKILTSIFPNLQFVVSTHSPFILNSLEEVVIYDLENHVLVENGLVNIPYEGIVEGYFKANTMSELLKEKYKRYR